MTENNKDIVTQLMSALDERDIDGVLSHCAPNAVWHGFAPEPLDNAGYRVAIQQFLDAFPDSRFPVSAYLADGDRVAAVHALDGTHNGAFQGIPPTGKPVHVPAIAVFRLTAGKVAETWLNADLMGLLIQIGAITLPTPA
jgi:steroid delta-isomerase-like uncharacterized protein